MVQPFGPLDLWTFGPALAKAQNFHYIELILSPELIRNENIIRDLVCRWFQIEMKFAAWKLGFKIKEVPIIFQDRKMGSSKMHKGIVKEGILGVLKLRWYSLFKDYHNRVKSSGNIYSSSTTQDEALVRK